MLKIKYTLPKTETKDDTGKITKITENVFYDEDAASTEILADEVRKLMALGYEVTATLKLKIPKD